MKSMRLERALEVTEWAKRPMVWAVRLRLSAGPFKTLRKLPLKVLCRVLELQVLATEKIAR